MCVTPRHSIQTVSIFVQAYLLLLLLVFGARVKFCISGKILRRTTNQKCTTEGFGVKSTARIVYNTRMHSCLEYETCIQPHPVAPRLLPRAQGHVRQATSVHVTRRKTQPSQPPTSVTAVFTWSFAIVPTAKYSESGCANTRADTDDAGIIDRDSLSSMPVSSAACQKTKSATLRV